MTDAELAPFERLASLVRYRRACVVWAVRWYRQNPLVDVSVRDIDAAHRAAEAAQADAENAGVSLAELDDAWLRAVDIGQARA